MPQKMTAEMVAASGVTCNHQEMENGERRFRLLGPDGSGYIRCENPGGPVWENSHLHHTTREFILVQQGPVICAVYRQGKAVLRLLETGDCFCPDPGVPHDLCMGAGAVVHAVKYGSCPAGDWAPSPELDMCVRKLSWEQALQLAEG